MFLQSGQLLLDFHGTLKALPVRMSQADAGDLLDKWKRFMVVVEPLDIYVPKFHLMYHCIMRSVWQGNPVLYQTFADESLNKKMKACLRLCHQAAFERMGLVKLAEALSRAR